MSTPYADIRHDWSQTEVLALFELPFNELLFRAHQVHRLYFNPREVQISTLLSIKTGACPEDCKYCPQSVRYDTGLESESIMDVEVVLEAANPADDHR
jgi:biotin synthase